MQILQQQNKQFRIGEITRDEKIQNLEDQSAKDLEIILDLRRNVETKDEELRKQVENSQILREELIQLKNQVQEVFNMKRAHNQEN